MRRRPAAAESETLSDQPARTPALRSKRQRHVKLKAMLGARRRRQDDGGPAGWKPALRVRSNANARFHYGYADAAPASRKQERELALAHSTLRRAPHLPGQS
jgi:hypothetical protein